MPPDPAPVPRALAADDEFVEDDVVFLCFNWLPPALDRGADNLLGDRPPEPTLVELAGTGYLWKFERN